MEGMNIQEITTKEEWNSVVGSQKMSQFLQSWEWGEFQKLLGIEIFRIAVHGKYLLAIKKPLPLGKSYLLIPRTYVDLSPDFINTLKDFAQSKGALFIRIEPMGEPEHSLHRVGDHDPSESVLLDLTKSEEELLAAMHQKTRYNIRLAEKKGVTVREGSEEDFPAFFALIKDTFSRKGKSLFNESYFKQLLTLDFAKLYVAEYEGKILVGNIVTYFGDTATYKDGGSSSEYKELMAPHLLQWFQIQEAKRQGYNQYDMWGISEEIYPGVTRFKKGFGGEEVVYPGTFEIPVSSFWYTLYQVAKKFI